MGTGTLTDRVAGQTIIADFWNSVHSVLKGDFVGHDSSGVAASGQNLGTAAYPWNVVRAESLILGGSAVDASQIVSPQNRLVSGKMRSTSNQPGFLKPAGSGASLTIEAATTDLVLVINGLSISVTTDLTASSLTLAPSSQNTATVNDAAAAGQESTRTWGEYRSERNLTITSAGTNITDRIGKFAAFKVVSGANTEYFYAFVESATKLSKCVRGFFYNSSYAPINRIKLTTGDTITLMSLAWVFVEDNSTTVGVSYTVPTRSFTAPSGPATNDYWYDQANETWKRYDGVSFVVINRTLVGMVVLDATNAVAARSGDFYANHRQNNSIVIEKSTSAIARSSGFGQRVTVNGIDKFFDSSLPTWDMAANLASSADMYNAAEQASTTYWLYVKDTGATVISDISPYWRPDMLGHYHPHNPWIAVGRAENDGSSNIQEAQAIGTGRVTVTKTAAYTLMGTDDIVIFNGDFAAIIPSAETMYGKTFRLKNKSVGGSGVTLTVAGSGTIDDETSQTLRPDAGAELFDDRTNWYTI